MMEYALITGGASGIGYELARQFARHGYGLLLTGSNRARLETAKAALTAEFSVPVHTFPFNLALPGSAKLLHSAIQSDGFAYSALVNNAGYGIAGAAEMLDPCEEEQMLQLNIITLLELSKLFLIARKGQGGYLLNVSSTGAFQPGPYTASYFASKAFVLHYSDAIRYEVRKTGLRVCTLCPGSTRTGFFAREGRETPKNAMSAEIVARYAYQRLMAGKRLAVPGLGNRLLRRLPSGIKMSFIARMKK